MRKALFPVRALSLIGAAGWKRWSLSRPGRVNRIARIPIGAPDGARDFLAWMDRRDHEAEDLRQPPTLTLDVGHSDDGRNIDSVFAVFCSCSGARDLNLFRGAEALLEQIEPLLTAGERARAAGGFFSIDEIQPAEEEALMQTGSLDIPVAARAAARRYLRYFRHHRPLIAASMGDLVQGQASGDDESWIRLFTAIHERYPDAVILLLNIIDDARSQSLPSYVRIIRNMGFGIIEAMALAQEADLYAGVLDLFGIAAWTSRQAGLYCTSAATPLAHQVSHGAHKGSSPAQIRIIPGSLAAEGPAALDRIMKRHTPRTLLPDDEEKLLSAHGFLKLWDRRDLVVVINPGDIDAVTDTRVPANLSELALRIRDRCPNAVLCLVTEGSRAGDETSELRDKSTTWWTTDAFGSSARDLAALVQGADAYVGLLDEHGWTAFYDGRPGVYVVRSRGSGVPSAATIQPDHCLQRTCENLDPDECAQVLADLNQCRLPA